jgi:hypothetical protein
MLTRKQHHARAALMGKLYDRRDGTYCDISNNGTASVLGNLDCLTLEPISSNSKADAERMRQRLWDAWGVGEYVIAEKISATRTAPWELPDDEPDGTQGEA